MASTLTSEELIAIAALHGCEFFRAPSMGYFVHGRMGHDKLHPLEAHRINTIPETHWGWPDRETLARDYCEWFGLLQEAT